MNIASARSGPMRLENKFSFISNVIVLSSLLLGDGDFFCIFAVKGTVEYPNNFRII